MNEISQYVAFCDWLLSACNQSSTMFHHVAESHFFLWLSSVLLYGWCRLSFIQQFQCWRIFVLLLFIPKDASMDIHVDDCRYKFPFLLARHLSVELRGCQVTLGLTFGEQSAFHSDCTVLVPSVVCVSSSTLVIVWLFFLLPLLMSNEVKPLFLWSLAMLLFFGETAVPVLSHFFLGLLVF